MAMALPAKKSFNQVKFQGGRSLKAIWTSTLSLNEKAVLNALASEQDFRGDFQAYRWMAISTLCQITSLGKTTVCATIAKLAMKGYLRIRRTTIKGKKAPNYYQLTSKIFDEYNPKPSSHSEPGPGSDSEHKLPQAAVTPSPSNLGTKDGAENLVPIEKAKREGTRQESRRIMFGSLAWGNDRMGYVPYSAVYAFADSLLDRYGIRTLREFKRRLEERGTYGQCDWKPRSIEAYFVEINEEMNGNPLGSAP